MKKFIVIGNPINHSLSPNLHNYWIKKYKIDAVYEKQKLDSNELKDLTKKIKEKKLDGINITVPFKKEIINFLDDLSPEAQKTESVNTIFLKDNKIFGHNTDINGFESALENINFKITNKKIFIIGAGGVVPSIIFALKRMKASEIIITNRTKKNAENLKILFEDIKIFDWGKIPKFDVVINATSIGLKNDDVINLDFSKIENDKFYYDVIYNPKETNFLKTAKNLGNRVENGKKMFLYQAAEAFKIWHGIEPEINEDVMELLDK